MSLRWDHPAPPTPSARSEGMGQRLRNWWGTVPKKMGHAYERRPKSAPLPVETAPHLRRNRAPLPVGISAPFRPESAVNAASGSVLLSLAEAAASVVVVVLVLERGSASGRLSCKHAALGGVVSRDGVFQ